MTTMLEQKTERYTLKLGKVAYTAQSRRNAVELELELREREGDVEVSICGGIWNATHTDYAACGQMIDEIAGLFRGSRKVQRIAALWKRWHLNTMKAGTPEQEAAINAWKAAGAKYDYTEACKYLMSVGLYEVEDPHYPDMQYRYGSRWLTEVVPDEIVNELRTLFQAATGVVPVNARKPRGA